MAYGQQIRVTGLNETIRSLKKAGVEGTVLKQAMSEGSQILASELRAQTPVRTGTLAASVRPGKAAGRANAREGGARPRHYAPFPNFGTRYQAAQEYAARAIRLVGIKAFRAVERNLNSVITRNGLK